MPTLDAEYGFLLVALVIFAGEVGVPTFLPGEIGLLLIGLQLIHSVAGLVLAIIAFAALDFVATSTLHLMARSGGNRLLRRALHRLRKDGKQPEAILEDWRSRIGGGDPVVIFVARLVPVLRMYASLLSGLLRLRLRDFFLAAAPAACVWAAFPLTLGFLLHRQQTMLSRHYTLVLHMFVAGSVVLALGLAVVWWRLQVRRRAARNARGVRSTAA
ncbi:MAG: hypothetical protein NVS2B16_02120 [Chloroflexota bacterium]